jgi:hypothetical protein
MKYLLLHSLCVKQMYANLQNLLSGYEAHLQANLPSINTTSTHLTTAALSNNSLSTLKLSLHQGLHPSNFRPIKDLRVLIPTMISDLTEVGELIEVKVKVSTITIQLMLPVNFF